MFRELYGDSALGNVVLVTNMWDAVPHDVGEARENELSDSFFKPVFDGGAQIVRHHNNTDSAHDVIRRITEVDCPVVLRIQRELVDEHKGIVDTSAGKTVNQELDEQLREHGAEFKKVWDDIMQAFMDKDEATRRDLEEEANGLQEQIERIKKDLEGMAENYAMEKERVEVTVEKMEQEPEREGQRTEAELTDLRHRLQDAISASAADRARLGQEVKERAVAKADHERRLVDLEHCLQGMVSAADRAEWERHQAESEKRYEVVTQMLEERTDQLWGQIEWIKKDSELKTRMKEQEAKESGLAEAALTELDHRLREATDVSANCRAILEQLVKERERADAEHKRLVELTCHLQDEIRVSTAHRVALEQAMKELQGRVATAVTVPPRVPPRPTPCAQIFLYSAAHDS